MSLRKLPLAATTGFIMLAACGGGGGGGVASTPTPVPVPTPTPTPTPPPVVGASVLLTNLEANQSFTSETTITNVKLTAATGVVQQTSGTRDTIQIAYDAATHGYIVTAGGRTQQFLSSDVQEQRFAGEIQYRHGSDYLTLVTRPYYFPTANNFYVAMGYWQHNDVSGADQQTQFSTFTYGADTAGSAVPRTGTAHWRTDVFGLLTAPGKELRSIQGKGNFDVDFAHGAFAVSGNVDEFNYITGDGRVGSLALTGGGSLGSGNSFQGDAAYTGSLGLMSGTMSGKFYGPAAEEAGANFLLTGSGATLTGAFTAQRDTSEVGPSTSLLDIRSSQRIFGTKANFSSQKRDSETTYGNVGATVGNRAFVSVTPQGVNEVSDGNYGYVPATADVVAGPANFTTYHKVINGVDTDISLYKVGAANTELQLSYLSFASWTATEHNAAPAGAQTSVNRYYIPYGFETPRGQLAARTGTATYAGVAYGAGASMAGASYEVSGTSSFSVNFSGATYSGSLSLTGRAPDNSTRNLGAFAFNGALNDGLLTGANFNAPAGAGSNIQPIFYGPNGQEIGAPFALVVGTTGDANAVNIAGIALAKR